MKIDQARAISLDIRKDPQSFVLIKHVRDEAWFYIRCLETENEIADHVGCLHFRGVWHIDSTRFRKYKHYPNTIETNLTSYYLKVDDSSLLSSLKKQRTQNDPDWQLYDKRDYKHWVVESHDFYTNIVASEVSFFKMEGGEVEWCFATWDKV